MKRLSPTLLCIYVVSLFVPITVLILTGKASF